MNSFNDVPGQQWGPQRTLPPGRDGKWMLALILLVVALLVPKLQGVLLLADVGVIAWRVYRRRQSRSPQPGLGARPVDHGAVLAESRRLGGGVYLGVGQHGGWRLAGRERAVLLLGPPRSGKTSGVMIPALLANDGPAVSTSTKPDVLAATTGARSGLGRVWRFDPTGSQSEAGGELLRWSPVAASGSWDGALLMARAMVTGAGVGQGTTDGSIGQDGRRRCSPRCCTQPRPAGWTSTGSATGCSATTSTPPARCSRTPAPSSAPAR